MATLFVSNLHPYTTEDELLEKFEPIGAVSSISIRKEVVFVDSNYYAFVNFQDEIDAKRALDTMNLEVVRDRPMHLKLYKPDVGKVFIKNLDKQIEEEYLFKVFAEFGNILNWKIAKNHLGKSIGSAFVHYETELAAETCIKIGNGNELGNEIIHIEKYNVLNENDEKLSEKEKLLKNFMMTVRHSLFKKVETCEKPRTDEASSASTSVSSISTKQQSMETEQREKLRQRLNSMQDPMLLAWISKYITKLLDTNAPFLYFIMENEEAFKAKIHALMLEMDIPK